DQAVHHAHVPRGVPQPDPPSRRGPVQGVPVRVGAYQAVDWALALRVLPQSETAGKDMGIWHVALVLPQVLGPALTGWIITGARLAVSARFAYSLAFAIAALWFSLSAILVARVRLRPDTGARTARE
ncbi:MAG: hypothetical protein ACREET_00265, partial [Stellaceae bacterium]